MDRSEGFQNGSSSPWGDAVGERRWSNLRVHPCSNQSYQNRGAFINFIKWGQSKMIFAQWFGLPITTTTIKSNKKMSMPLQFWYRRKDTGLLGRSRLKSLFSGNTAFVKFLDLFWP